MKVLYFLAFFVSLVASQKSYAQNEKQLQSFSRLVLLSAQQEKLIQLLSSAEEQQRAALEQSLANKMKALARLSKRFPQLPNSTSAFPKVGKQLHLAIIFGAPRLTSNLLQLGADPFLRADSEISAFDSTPYEMGIYFLADVNTARGAFSCAKMLLRSEGVPFGSTPGIVAAIKLVAPFNL